MLTHLFQGELDLLALHYQNPSRYPFLLESVSRSAQNRYSLLFAFPQAHLRLDSLDQPAFCQCLDEQFQASTQANNGVDLPFRGGWFLYLGYELAGQLEPTLNLPSTALPLPIAMAVRIPAAVIIDHI